MGVELPHSLCPRFRLTRKSDKGFRIDDKESGFFVIWVDPTKDGTFTVEYWELPRGRWVTSGVCETQEEAIRLAESLILLGVAGNGN